MFLLTFVETLLAINYTEGVHHIKDSSTGNLLLASLSGEVPIMARSTISSYRARADATVVFVKNRVGYTILLGNRKLCLRGGRHVDLCSQSETTNEDDFRFVVGSHGTSIRNQRNCLTISYSDKRYGDSFIGLTATPCKEKIYSFFDIVSTSDSNPLRSILNRFGGFSF